MIFIITLVIWFFSPPDSLLSFRRPLTPHHLPVRGGYSPVSPGYSPAPSPPVRPRRPAPHRPAPPPPAAALGRSPSRAPPTPSPEPPRSSAPQLYSGYAHRPVATRDASTQLRTILRAAITPLFLHTRKPEDGSQHYTIVPSWVAKMKEEIRGGECVICFRENAHFQVNKCEFFMFSL